MREECDVEFFRKDYDGANPICDGTTCANIEDCVMDLWMKGVTGLVEKEQRKKIIAALAEITVKVNQEIAKVFEQVRNDGQLPKEPPVFKLVLIRCPSWKPIGLDIDV